MDSVPPQLLILSIVALAVELASVSAVFRLSFGGAEVELHTQKWMI